MLASGSYERTAELKAFDETKAGVKGLVDNGITKIPRIFIHNNIEPSFSSSTSQTHVCIPIIDLSEVGTNPNSRSDIIEKVRGASETLGFFQVVNHGISQLVLDEMLEGTRRFYEQDVEIKKGYYTRDSTKKMVYHSNFDLFTGPAANWRDSFYCAMAPHPPTPEDLPSTCRDILFEFSEQVMRLGKLLMELLSEALGLNRAYLNDIGCSEGLAVLCHYYPACPQPELTLGASKHADDGFLTVLLQDQISGLQILHDKQWIDVPPVPGALVINIADLLQLISNDKFKSIQHRVVANREGPRLSVASFFTTAFQASSKVYEPIKELTSETNPPKYKQVSIREYTTYVQSKGLNGVSPLLNFRL